MTLVVDASVAVKWFVPEPDELLAQAVLEDGSALIAPDLILAEAGNAIWRKWRAGDLSEELADAAVGLLPSYFDRLDPVADLLPEAWTLAKILGHPVYDCCYVALARAQSARLVTADGGLMSAIVRSEYGRFVRSLDSFAS